MKRAHLLPMILLVTSAFTSTGCFRVSSDTRALREAALRDGSADEKIEIGVGFFTVGLAKFASRYLEMPREGHLAISALKNAECAVYDVRRRTRSFSAILAEADQAMARKGCDRLVGVIHEKQLVAVYVPHDVDSPRRLRASILVLNDRQLVCATAEADARDLIELALEKVEEELPERTEGRAL